jgi:hypothetical protein
VSGTVACTRPPCGNVRKARATLCAFALAIISTRNHDQIPRNSVADVIGTKNVCQRKADAGMYTRQLRLLTAMDCRVKRSGGCRCWQQECMPLASTWRSTVRRLLTSGDRGLVAKTVIQPSCMASVSNAIQADRGRNAIRGAPHPVIGHVLNQGSQVVALQPGLSLGLEGAAQCRPACHHRSNQTQQVRLMKGSVLRRQSRRHQPKSGLLGRPTIWATSVRRSLRRAMSAALSKRCQPEPPSADLQFVMTLSGRERYALA